MIMPGPALNVLRVLTHLSSKNTIFEVCSVFKGEGTEPSMCSACPGQSQTANDLQNEHR